jgi:LPPG:FO 2-phospho-L-lactate transferase
MSDEDIPTIVYTDEGKLPFQEYFVHRGCEPRVTGFQFKGVDQAFPAPGVIPAIEDANLIVICPSNPWVSIDPILSIPGIKRSILTKRKEGTIVLAVTPIIGGRAIKGPLAKMYLELGMEPSAYTVAEHYSNLIDYFVLDGIDQGISDAVKTLKVRPICLNTIMKTKHDRKILVVGILSKLNRLWK